MASSKILIFSIFFALVIFGTRPGLEAGKSKSKSEKISHLESAIQEKETNAVSLWKKKWIPAVKDIWIAFTTFGGHIKKASTKLVAIFELCRTTPKPHIFALRDFADPFVQEAKTFVKSYVELAATVLKPYTRMVVYGYRKLLEATGKYHQREIAAANLNEHGQPALGVLVQKKRIPSLKGRFFSQKWIPSVKDIWIAFTTFGRHIKKEAKTFVKSYVELAATVLKPYTRTVVYGYRKLLEATGKYQSIIIRFKILFRRILRNMI